MLALVAEFKLGRDKAPVRLGGLYALERLAQDNPAHRQTIVNVICAYLCMPFSPAAPASKSEPGTTQALEVPAAEAEASTLALGDTEIGRWQQERQVRLTAQRILAEHLRDDRAQDQRSTEPPSQRFCLTSALREFRVDGDEPGRLGWRSQCPGATATAGGTALPA
jgi:hypothetical protein